MTQESKNMINSPVKDYPHLIFLHLWEIHPSCNLM